MTHIKSRITREKKIVELMIRLYCKRKERNRELCPACQDLLKYAHARLEHCPFGEKKSVYAPSTATSPKCANECKA
jgi:hypothetical protein